MPDQILSELRRMGLHSIDELPQVILDRSQPEERRLVGCYVAGAAMYRPAVRALLQVITQDNERLVWEAGVALSRIGSKRATRPLVNVIRYSEVEESRTAAIYAFFGIQDSRAVPTLINVLSDTSGSPRSRSVAAEVLGLLEPTDASVNELRKALHDPAAEAIATSARIARDALDAAIVDVS